ncbi:DUF2889 domain-containing protein [Pseudomonas nitroreducens]|uniref:DUF2889 domain-containing protein n=1 Tax=Pseudomonas nitroreducens TaxID=46680 RepID=UPI003CC810B8
MNDNDRQVPSRQLLHTRRVTCTGYQRSDGWFDVEGQLHDSKAHDERLLYKVLPAGEAVHGMKIRMTVDRDLVIRELVALTEDAPTPFCASINAAYAALQGVRVGPGFRKQVLQRVGDVKGCTHLTELLWPMATTVFQTTEGLFYEENLRRAAQDPDYQPPAHWVIGSCHVYHADGEPARLLSERPDHP